MAHKYEMGEMPDSPEDYEMAMEGADYEAEDVAPEGGGVSNITEQLVGLSRDELREVEASVADALSQLEEEDEVPAEDESTGENPGNPGGDVMYS